MGLILVTSIPADDSMREPISSNGTINGNLPIEINFDVAGDGTMSEEYLHLKNRVSIGLRGAADDGGISLEEYLESFQTKQRLTGTWPSADKRKILPLQLAAAVDSPCNSMDSPAYTSSTLTTRVNSGGGDRSTITGNTCFG